MNSPIGTHVNLFVLLYKILVISVNIFTKYFYNDLIHDAPLPILTLFVYKNALIVYTSSNRKRKGEMKMDNNFNMQQNNTQQPANQQPVYQQPVNQQPMYQQPAYQQPMAQQPMYQQPMYQQPMAQQPKKKTGLIIGIVSAVVALIAIIAVVLILVLGGDDDSIVGSWKAEDGTTMVFNDDNTGSMGNSGLNMPMTWKMSGDTITITISMFGQSTTQDLIIVEFTGDKLVLSAEGDEQTFTRTE